MQKTTKIGKRHGSNQTVSVKHHNEKRINWDKKYMKIDSTLVVLALYLMLRLEVGSITEIINKYDLEDSIL